MRINQYIAHASGLSRRQADAAIAEGRVRLNNAVAPLGATVAPDDAVELDGVALNAPIYQTIALHKPPGYVTSRRKQGTTPTIYALLPVGLHVLKPVGRLDRDSSGLLLLTNDGELAQQLQHPSRGHRKRYEVQLDRRLQPDDAKQLQQGVKLDDGLSRLAVEQRHGYIEVWLEEGRNRQIRRSFAALGYRVTRLHRTNVGDLVLGDLASGQWQPVTPPNAPRKKA